ncbi:MAG: indolepyruvate oxidoreductase subunit beta [Verrucomicrobiota bacterium]
MSARQDIIIAGVGGQGILTVAGVIGAAAVHRGLYVKQSEVHGMAQRGGAVVSHLRLSERPIASDLIPRGTGHLILSMEPMEALRYLPFVHREAALVTNQNPVRNVPAYPDLGKILARVRQWPRHVIVDAEKLARQAGNVRAVNSVMLGAAAPFLMVPAEALVEQIAEFFTAKGEEVVAMNIKAFELGRAAAG